MARASSSVRPANPRAPAPRAIETNVRPLRAVVIEDETMFRQLLTSTLRTIAGVQIVAEFGAGRPALQFCQREAVDLLVVDLVLPDIDGLEIARQMRAASEELIILIVTAHPNEKLPAELIALGVAGYVDKNESIDYVVNAVATLRRGGMFFASHVQAQRDIRPILRRRSVVADTVLTDREREIARLVAAGKMTKEIAALLSLSPRTIENHRAAIMQKVGVHDVASLTRWCIETGLLYT